MTKMSKELNDRLKSVFKEEGLEINIKFVKFLEELDEKKDDESVRNIESELARLIHSLKASTAILGYKNMSEFLCNLENEIHGQSVSDLYSIIENLRNDMCYLIEKEEDIISKS